MRTLHERVSKIVLFKCQFVRKKKKDDVVLDRALTEDVLPFGLWFLESHRHQKDISTLTALFMACI